MNTEGYFDLPLSLLVSVKDKSEYDYTTRNILNFYNLYDSTIVDPESKFPHQIIEKESNKSIIKHLNFIRLNTNYTSTTSLNDRVQERLSVSDDTIIPSFSCVLITNNSIIATSGRQNNLTQLNRNDWVYNHKVDLNDQNGTPIARQLFYKLTNNLPLIFSRSNWTPPHNLNTLISESVEHTIANTPCKYIVRLNINCINYDSMLYFYRLLFSKCSNYSKKNFSLFVLKTSRLDNISVNKASLITVEYQLSLKYDPNAIVQTSKNTALIYQVNDFELFNKIVRVLERYSHELITKKVFSVQDPDRNKIFLVDTSVRFTMPIFSIANSIGISENYFRILQNIQKSSRLNMTPMTTTTTTTSSPSSSSSTSSFSYSPNSMSVDIQASSNVTTTPASTTTSKQNNSAKSIKSKKKIKKDQKLLKESKNKEELRWLSSSSTSQISQDPPVLQMGSVRDLINRFSRRLSVDRRDKKNQLEVRNYSRSRSQNGFAHSSCTNLNKLQDSPPILNNSILQDNTNLEMLNIEKLRRKQQACLLEANQMLRQRSQSAMNEPYTQSNTAKNVDPAISSFSSSANSSTSSISMFIKPKATRNYIPTADSYSTLNRNKSASATNINESYHKNSGVNFTRNELNHIPRSNELRPRSKSTVPFNELKSDNNNNSLETSCYLVADVDKASYEYIRSGTYNFNQQESRPFVGITPSTRFRRAPTLDMIRSTRMPVQHPPYLTVLNASPALIRRPINYLDFNGHPAYFNANIDARNDIQIAKF